MGKVTFGQLDAKKAMDEIKSLPQASIVIQEKIVEVPVDRIVEVQVDRIVEVEKIVNVPVEKQIDRIVEKKIACTCKDYSQDIQNCRSASEIRDQELNDLYESLLSQQNVSAKKLNALDMDINSMYKMHDLKMNEFENKVKSLENKNKLYLLVVSGLIILSLLI